MRRNNRTVYVVDGSRTPFIKAGLKPNPCSAADLAVAAIRPLLARQPFRASELGEVVVGCVAPAADETNIGRLIALRVGCGDQVPGWTVQRNCASGLQAIDCAAQDIAYGRHDLVLAGGTEAMSRAPLLFSDKMVSWLSLLNTTKGLKQKLFVLSQFKFPFLKPEIALLKGLFDPVVNLSMGQTAEQLAYQFGITRMEMDKFALQSHQRAFAAAQEKKLSEITPLFDGKGGYIDSDNGVRQDCNLEKLGLLKPVFDKPFGNVTAGNSSQVSDGAAFVILASESAVKKYRLPILGKIVDTAWAALAPAMMGLGPVHAISQLLLQNHLTLQDIECWEINEAFAAQVLACLSAFEDENYCIARLGQKQAMGSIDLNCLNQDGGAIAIGHPVGASGARLVLHTLHCLKRNDQKRGVASLCIGGGQGGAILLERVAGEI